MTIRQSATSSVPVKNTLQILILVGLCFSFHAIADIHCTNTSCAYTYEMPLNQDSPELRYWWVENFPGTSNSLCVPVSLATVFSEISGETLSRKSSGYFLTWRSNNFAGRVTQLALRLGTDGNGTEPEDIENITEEFVQSFEPALERIRINAYRNPNHLSEVLRLARQGYYISVRAGYFDIGGRQNGHRFILQSISESGLSLLDPQTGNIVTVSASNGFVSERPLIERLIDSSLVIESFDAIKP